MDKLILTVLMQPEGAPEDAEPVELTVTTILADQKRAEREMRQRGAGTSEDSPIFFGSALAWAALAREGRISCKLDEFDTRVFNLKQLEGAGEVDPTQPPPSTDSASPSPSPTPAPVSTTGTPPSTPATTG